MASDWKSAFAAMQAAGEADFPPMGLHYVLQLARTGFREKGNQALSPEDFTEVFRQRTRRDFGPMTDAVLGDWGLLSPVDLGKAVLLLGRHGCLTLAPEDTMEAFAVDNRPFAQS